MHPQITIDLKKKKLNDSFEDLIFRYVFFSLITASIINPFDQFNGITCLHLILFKFSKVFCLVIKLSANQIGWLKESPKIKLFKKKNNNNLVSLLIYCVIFTIFFARTAYGPNYSNSNILNICLKNICWIIGIQSVNKQNLLKFLGDDPYSWVLSVGLNAAQLWALDVKCKW